MAASMTYEEAYAELVKIATEIETESVSVDLLAIKVRRASELINYCQQKLRAAEDEVNKVIDQMGSAE
ncbi:MAG: exodeoxyribonuclease VII small subunit [Gemmatimonadaceae bacterium]|nr:exodeoxyribonuclease VII small subunit [Chitinophagaceae bacterium]